MSGKMLAWRGTYRQIKNLNDKIGDAELNNDLATIIFYLSEPEISHTLIELIDRATAKKVDDESKSSVSANIRMYE